LLALLRRMMVTYLALRITETTNYLWLLTGVFDNAEQEAIAYPKLSAFNDAAQAYAVSRGTNAP
jgi:hypothetical protein